MRCAVKGFAVRRVLVVTLIVICKATLEPSHAEAQMREQYEKARDAYLDAERKAPAYQKACYHEWAEYYDCVARSLDSSSRGATCTEPTSDCGTGAASSAGQRSESGSVNAPDAATAQARDALEAAISELVGKDDSDHSVPQRRVEGGSLQDELRHAEQRLEDAAEWENLAQERFSDAKSSGIGGVVGGALSALLGGDDSAAVQGQLTAQQRELERAQDDLSEARRARVAAQSEVDRLRGAIQSRPESRSAHIDPPPAQSSASNATASSGQEDVALWAQDVYLGALGYENGTGNYKTNLSAALDAYRTAAKAGNLSAQIRLANDMTLGIDIVEKEQWRLAAAEQGDAQSQFSVGLGYALQGDHSRASEWYMRAGNQGNVAALVELSRLIEMDSRIAIDPGTMFNNYKASASKGDAHAMYLVGKSYFEGAGVPKDTAQAELWFKRAVRLGDHSALAFLENGSTLDGPPIAQDETLSGVIVCPLSDATIQALGLPRKIKGVIVVYVSRGTAAAAEMLRAGDIVMEIKHHKTRTLAEYRQALAQPDSGLWIWKIFRQSPEREFCAIIRPYELLPDD